MCHVLNINTFFVFVSASREARQIIFLYEKHLLFYGIYTIVSDIEKEVENFNVFRGGVG